MSGPSTPDQTDTVSFTKAKSARLPDIVILRGPVDFTSGRNHPLWVRVRTTADTSAGLYQGEISLQAKDFEAVAPIEVEVFDFALPDRMTLSTVRSFASYQPGNRALRRG